jgi:hypothetical protein
MLRTTFLCPLKVASRNCYVFLVRLEGSPFGVKESSGIWIVVVKAVVATSGIQMGVAGFHSGR